MQLNASNRPRLVLHIGTDKAGSTAIQSHLALNRSWLGRRHCYVPLVGLGSNNGHAQLFQQADAELWVELAEEVQTAVSEGAQQIVLSWEGLNFFNAQALATLQENLPALPLKIVIYVREQAEIVQSGFLQEIKRLANTCPITTFQSKTLILRLRQQRRARYPVTRDYYRLARRWEKAFPQPDMAVRLFSKDHLRGGDVIEDFLYCLGLELSTDFVRLEGPGNPSLDAVSGYLIDQMRQLGVPRQELEQLVDVALSVNAHIASEDRFFLDQHTVDGIRRHFDGSNRKLASRYLGQSGNPFDCQKMAWASEGEEGIRRRLLQKMRQLSAVDSIVSFSGEGLAGADIQKAGLLQSGWQTSQSWGCWCEGSRSTLYFRVLRQRLLPEHNHLHIYIRGQYAAEDSTTTVVINSLQFDGQRLGHDRPGLDLPLARLGDYDTVTIELKHQGEFALEFFGFELRGTVHGP